MPTLTYDQEVTVVEMGFEFELCAECLRDLDEHVIAPDMFGHPHAWCIVEEEV